MKYEERCKLIVAFLFVLCCAAGEGSTSLRLASIDKLSKSLSRHGKTAARSIQLVEMKRNRICSFLS